MNTYSTTVKPSQFQRIKVIIAGICAVILTVGIARFSYTPLLPLMQSDASLSPFMGGLLATYNYLGYFSGILLISFSSSLHFKYQLYRFGLLTAVITTIAMGLTQDPLLWSILRFISGISSTAGILLAAGFVLSWLRNRHFPAELGLHFTGIGLGIALSGIAVILMTATLAWNQQWQLFGIIGIAFLLPAWYWMPAPELPLQKHSEISPPPPSTRWMWLMIACYFCAGFGYVISATFIVSILENLPLLTNKGAWSWVLLGLAAIPSAFMWDRISRKTGELNALIISFIAHFISIILPALFDNSPMNLFAAMLFGNTFTGIVSLTLAYVGRAFPSNPAKAMARLTASYGIAQIIGPAIAGYLAIQSGDYRNALWLASLFILLGLLFLTMLKRNELNHRHAERY